MNETVILRNINKSFGDKDSLTQVLYDINLQLASQKLVFITGPSGCGKTTLISIIAGILNSDSGEINLLGIEQNSLTTEEKAVFRQKNLGFIFQQFNLVPTLTVLENAAVPLLIQDIDYAEALEQSAQMIAKVGLAHKVNSFPKDLSGGQQQRVAIARALVNNPKILICDEPTAALDSNTGHSIMELIKEISMNEDRCVIVVTHDNRIYKYADQFIRMEDGKIQDVVSQ